MFKMHGTLALFSRVMANILAKRPIVRESGDSASGEGLSSVHKKFLKL
jgi:hypothetical protein